MVNDKSTHHLVADANGFDPVSAYRLFRFWLRRGRGPERRIESVLAMAEPALSGASLGRSNVGSWSKPAAEPNSVLGNGAGSSICLDR